MADTIEKVYCTGDGGNDNLAAALLARGRDNDPATMLAAMNGGMGGDPDGYEGMAFCRWTADIIGNGVTIDWEKLE